MGKHYSFEAENDHEALLAIMAHLNREGVGNAIDALIERLDVLDGDPDIEDIDEREPDDDAKGDVSWPEWHTRARRRVVETLSGAHEPMAYHAGVGMAHEDDEDDDPLEGNGDERDTNNAEDEGLSGIGAQWANHGYFGPACPISDPVEPSLGIPEEQSGRWGGNVACGGNSDYEMDDAPELRRPHRDRIHRDQCDMFQRWGETHYRLKGNPSVVVLR